MPTKMRKIIPTIIRQIARGDGADGIRQDPRPSPSVSAVRVAVPEPGRVPGHEALPMRARRLSHAHTAAARRRNRSATLLAEA